MEFSKKLDLSLHTSRRGGARVARWRGPAGFLAAGRLQGHLSDITSGDWPGSLRDSAKKPVGRSRSDRTRSPRAGEILNTSPTSHQCFSFHPMAFAIISA